MTDRVVIINEGRIIADGNIGDLSRTPWAPTGYLSASAKPRPPSNPR